MKTEVVEAADRDVRNIVSRKSSGKNSAKSRTGRTSIILDNNSNKGDINLNATAL